MKDRYYEEPQIELVMVDEDVITASGDNYVDDPWIVGGWGY
jgi:hypothetical protein